MKRKKVTTLDVIKAFYIGDELLSDIFSIAKKKRKKEVPKALREMVKKANKLSKKDLLTYHLDNYHPRYDNYLNSTWETKDVALKDCGVWPRMGGLPDAATKGTVMDTAAYLKPLLEDKNKLTLDTSRALYIEEMMKWAEAITKYVPIIVVEGGLIRHHKLRKAKNRQRYTRCKYDIDDGNHRALAYALLGKKRIKAHVGSRVCKSNLLYS